MSDETESELDTILNNLIHFNRTDKIWGDQEKLALANAVMEYRRIINYIAQDAEDDAMIRKADADLLAVLNWRAP